MEANAGTGKGDDSDRREPVAVGEVARPE
jgi:hypothetical protein